MPSDSVKATSTIDTSIAADACKMKVMSDGVASKKNQEVLEGGRSKKEKRRKISFASYAIEVFASFDSDSRTVR